MFFEVAFTQLSITKEAFFRHKFGCQDLTGGVIYTYQQIRFWSPFFQPGVLWAINLHQFSTAHSPRSAQVGFLYLFALHFPNTGFDHQPAHSLFTQANPLLFFQLLSHQGWPKSVHDWLLDEVPHCILNLCARSPVAWLPALPWYQSCVSFLSIALQNTSELPCAYAKFAGCCCLGDPMV